MKTALLRLVVFVCATGATAHAWAADAPAAIQTEYSRERQQLSNGSSDWYEQAVRVRRTRGQREAQEVAVVQAQRFGLTDNQYGVLLVHPLGESLTMSAEASTSPEHQFLPQRSVGLQLQYELGPHWLAHAGAKESRYTDLTVAQGTLGLEHYVSVFSWALFWRQIQALGQTASSTELRGNLYYGDKSYIGLSYAAGQEVAQVSGSTLQLVEVQSVALSGRHELLRRWFFNYGVSSTRQGDFYTRNGVRLGVQYLF